MISRVISLFTLLFCGMLFAGDAATFCSIGWSEDNAYYAFAQFGEQDGSGFPYAELYVVDVEKNDFVPAGVFEQLWQDEVDSGANGINVLLELRVQADSLLAAYNISAREHMLPVFKAEGQECEHAAWSHSESFVLDLVQQAKGDAGTYESEAAFHLLFKPNDDSTLTIGNKNRYRKNVLRYDINRVFHSSDTKTLVVVIRLTKLGFEGPDIRYMVETLRLPQ